MKRWQLVALIALLIFLMGAWGGYALRKKTYQCPEPTNTTVVIHDTVTHNIPTYVPYYIIRRDSIVYRDTITIAGKVDTAFILRDYYAKHYSTSKWEDSLLLVNQVNMVTENQIYPQSFTYKILRPQTVHTTTYTSTTYNRYVYLGASTLLSDTKQTYLTLNYAGPKSILGLGYNPTYGFSIQAGFKIINFKTVK